MNYCIGIEYHLLKEIELRLGYNNNEDVLSGGFSLNMKKVILEFGIKAQASLGNSSAVTILFPIK